MKARYKVLGLVSPIATWIGFDRWQKYVLIENGKQSFRARFEPLQNALEPIPYWQIENGRPLFNSYMRPYFVNQGVDWGTEAKEDQVGRLFFAEGVVKPEEPIDGRIVINLPCKEWTWRDIPERLYWFMNRRKMAEVGLKKARLIFGIADGVQRDG